MTTPIPDEELAIEEIYRRAMSMDHESLATGFAAAAIALTAVGKERDEARQQLSHVIDEMERMSLRAESAEASADEICVERDRAEEQISEIHARLGCERETSNRHDYYRCAIDLIDARTEPAAERARCVGIVEYSVNDARLREKIVARILDGHEQHTNDEVADGTTESPE